MNLASGSRLGAYEIVAPLGSGGMGEVFRATDTRLGRDVAIKLLPEAFASDPERLARFEREAKLLASLNHPGIAHLDGFEAVTLDDTARAHLLVMELAEGEDLAERLKRGPLPLDDAIAVARQVAEALEEAHEKGIVHRDLKPANVKLNPDGQVKVLDFGLAKAWTSDAAAAASSPELSQSPTLAHTGTAAGLILGTAAYMSPEQARGKPVDKRADVWAFGVLLYELLTGQKLFQGETVSDVLAAVLTREPAWQALPAATPFRVRRLLERCLERDPKLRLRDIGEARIALASPEAPARESEEDTRRTPASALRRAVPWALAMGLAAALVAERLGPGDPAPGPDKVSFVFDTADALTPMAKVSPDGRVVAFNQLAPVSLRRHAAARRQLRRDAAAARERPQPEFLLVARRKRDGPGPAGQADRRGCGVRTAAHDRRGERGRARARRRLGPGRQHRVLRGRHDLPREGGGRSARPIDRAPAGPLLLARLSDPAAGRSARGVHLGDPRGRRERAGDPGGVARGPGRRPRRPQARDAGGRRAGPARLGQHRGRAAGGAGRSREPRAEGRADPAGAAGELRHAKRLRGGVAVHDRRHRLAARAGPAERVRLVRQERPPARAPGRAWPLAQLRPVGGRHARDRGDAPARVVGEPVPHRHGAGHHLARARLAGDRERPHLVARRHPDRLPPAQHAGDPAGARRQRVRAAGGNGLPGLVEPRRPLPRVRPRPARQVRSLRDRSGRERQDSDPAREWSHDRRAAFFADGRWVAYHGAAGSEQAQVSVIPFPPTGERWQISGDGGVQPRWSPLGDELFYLDRAGRLTSVKLPGSDPRRAGAPQPLFEAALQPSNVFDQFAVASRDRFLFRLPFGEDPGVPVHVIVGWDR